MTLILLAMRNILDFLETIPRLTQGHLNRDPDSFLATFKLYSSFLCACNRYMVHER